jgi:hypothetical protein
VDREGQVVTESQLAILRAAACTPDTLARQRAANHHTLVQAGAKVILEDEKTAGGQLGRPSGARYKTYERLKAYQERVRGTLFDSLDLQKALDDIYRYPLRESARDALNRQLRVGISDEALAELVITRREEDRLCVVEEEPEQREPQIICSLGLV